MTDAPRPSVASIAYVSTRGRTPAVGIKAAIHAGLAPDGGLYVPCALPHLDPAAFDPEGTLADTAATLLAPFFAGDPLATELRPICAEAFDFPVPATPLRCDDAGVLELFHGPTAAFKDIGARFLAACMRRWRTPGAPTLTILVATSGDTGAAVGAAFHGQPGIEIVILYPDGRVSPRQAHQLGSFGGNVHTLRVAGRFDDCQRMVTAALNDHSLRAARPLSSANSISLGRLLPQMTYYAHTALRWWHAHHAAPGFVVPTGNLGNALAAVWARACGLPIGPLRLACNANATLPEFFAGGEYRPRAAVHTLANAMDVGAPSNFERLRWTFGGDDVRLRANLIVRSVDDEAIRRTIAHHAHAHGEFFCPHTATAVHLLDGLRRGGGAGAWFVVATADPAKFPEIVEPLAGRAVPLPPQLAAMLERPSRADPIAASVPALRSLLLERVQ